MNKAVIRKFTFDNDFDQPIPAPKIVAEVVEPVAPPPPTFSEAELETAAANARKTALAEGIAQGRREALDQNERQVASALGAISTHLAAVDKDVQGTADGLVETAIMLSLRIVGKLFPELTRQYGLGEIEALVARCLDNLKTESRFAVRVSEEHTEQLRSRIDETAAARGFEGKITVLGDAAIKPGDCQIEWAQGGMIRQGADIWSDLEASLTQGLASLGTVTETTTTETNAAGPE